MLDMGHFLITTLVHRKFDALKKLSRNKRSSLFASSVTKEEKRFLTLTPEANVIKLFLSVIYGFS
jgi:hypothetical protein